MKKLSGRQDYRGTQTGVNSNTVNSKMSEGINGYMSVVYFVDFNMPKGDCQ